jgi:hypothetical protein
LPCLSIQFFICLFQAAGQDVEAEGEEAEGDEADRDGKG